jgi:hypothetical protein
MSRKEAFGSYGHLALPLGRVPRASVDSVAVVIWPLPSPLRRRRVSDPQLQFSSIKGDTAPCRM